MPPKAKYTREEIVEVALKLAADKGLGALTARELGAALGTSSRPIFTAFKNMGDVLAEVRKAAFVHFGDYIRSGGDGSPAFKQVGVRMISFAQEQPKLYRLLFMTEKPEARTFEDVFYNLGELAPVCIDTIKFVYDLDEEDAMFLFKQVWIFTYGIGSLIATGMCSFENDEIQSMLTNEFQAMLMLIKSGRAGKDAAGNKS